MKAELQGLNYPLYDLFINPQNIYNIEAYIWQLKYAHISCATHQHNIRIDRNLQCKNYPYLWQQNCLHVNNFVDTDKGNFYIVCEVAFCDPQPAFPVLM